MKQGGCGGGLPLFCFPIAEVAQTYFLTVSYIYIPQACSGEGEDQNGVGEVVGASQVHPVNVQPRKKLAYKLVLRNNSPTTTYTGLGLTITMPAGVTYVKAGVEPHTKASEISEGTEEEPGLELDRRKHGRNSLRRKQRKDLKKGNRVVTSKFLCGKGDGYTCVAWISPRPWLANNACPSLTTLCVHTQRPNTADSTITWKRFNMKPLSDRKFMILVKVDRDVPRGTRLTFRASIFQTLGEGGPTCETNIGGDGPGIITKPKRRGKTLFKVKRSVATVSIMMSRLARRVQAPNMALNRTADIDFLIDYVPPPLHTPNRRLWPDRGTEAIKTTDGSHQMCNPMDHV